MTNIVRFNVGRKQYEVSESLLMMHPDFLLAQKALEQELLSPGEEVVFENDGIRFRCILDYLCDDGHVNLPMTVPKQSFLAELVCYGIKNVDESKIVGHYGSDPQDLAQIQKEISSKISDVLCGWHVHCSVLHLARECAVRYLSSGGMLHISIHGPNKKLTRQEGIILCPCEAWFFFSYYFME